MGELDYSVWDWSYRMLRDMGCLELWMRGRAWVPSANSRTRCLYYCRLLADARAAWWAMGTTNLWDAACPAMGTASALWTHAGMRL